MNKNTNSKIFTNYIAVVAMTIMIAVISVVSISVTSYAEDVNADAQSFSGEVNTLSSDVDARKSPDSSAEIVASFKAGEPVYVLGESNGWVTIYYKGEEIYIKNSEGLLTSTINTEEVAEEMEKQAQTDKAWIESYESQLKAERNAKIWRIIIAVIIIGLVGYIVYATIKQNKNNSDDVKTDKSEEKK